MRKVNGYRAIAESWLDEAYAVGPPQLSVPQLICDRCNGARYLRKRSVKWDEKAKETEIIPCPDCQRPLEERLAQAGVRKTFAEWQTSDATNPAYIAVHEVIDGKRWCAFLRGGYGCGKTHLAMASAGAWVERGGTAVVVNTPDFLSRLRDAIDDRDSSIHRQREAYATVGLLVLDDFGAERSTEWTQEQLFQTIDKRYREKLPLILTSNVLKDDDLDPRILSRLRPHSISIRTGDKRMGYERR